MRIATLAGIAGALLMLAPAAARADLTVGADVVYDLGVSDGIDDYTGFGVEARLGYELDLGLIRVTPELGAGFHGLDPAEGETARLEPEIDVKRAYVGARAGLAGPIAPVAFAHLGYGRLDFSDGFDHDAGMTLDLGAGVDFTALPVLDLGVHAAWYSLDPGEGDALGWIGLGAHLQLYF